MARDKSHKNLYIIGGVVAVALIILVVYVILNKDHGTICNRPYILVGNSCCLDQNGNNICDKDESQATSQVQQQTSQQPTMMEGVAKSLARDYVYNNGYLQCCAGGCRTRPYSVTATDARFDGTNWIVSVDLIVGLSSPYNEYGDPTALTQSSNTFIITVDQNGNMKSDRYLSC